MSAKTYLNDMQEKHPEMLPDEIIEEFCVIDEYKHAERCTDQPGDHCKDCWNQEMNKK